MPIILLFGGVRQEDGEFDIVSLGYRVRPQREEGKREARLGRGRKGGRDGGRE